MAKDHLAAGESVKMLPRMAARGHLVSSALIGAESAESEADGEAGNAERTGRQSETVFEGGEGGRRWGGPRFWERTAVSGGTRRPPETMDGDGTLRGCVRAVVE